MAENSKLRISLTRFSCKQIYEQPAHRNSETFHIKKELRKKKYLFKETSLFFILNTGLRPALKQMTLPSLHQHPRKLNLPQQSQSKPSSQKEIKHHQNL